MSAVASYQRSAKGVMPKGKEEEESIFSAVVSRVSSLFDSDSDAASETVKVSKSSSSRRRASSADEDLLDKVAGFFSRAVSSPGEPDEKASGTGGRRRADSGRSTVSTASEGDGETRKPAREPKPAKSAPSTAKGTSKKSGKSTSVTRDGHREAKLAGGSSLGDEDKERARLKGFRLRGSGQQINVEKADAQGRARRLSPQVSRKSNLGSIRERASSEHVEGRMDGSKIRRARLIGEGAVGRVHLAQHTETGELFAVKVLNKVDIMDRNKVERAFMEREIAMRGTAHPLIATCRCAFQTDEEIQFVYEYCPGGELFRLMRRQPARRLAENEARFFAAELVLALEHLHTLGFVHRDVKPENVVLARSGHIRLVDFDLGSRKVEAMSGISSSGVGPLHDLVGTLEYMAPEMIRGEACACAAVDWWSLGIMMYEMVYGRTPFRGPGDKKRTVIDNILHAPLKFPATPFISSSCKDLIRLLLARDRRSRLGSPEQGGSSAIKDHPWFSGVSWGALPRSDAPFVPELEGAFDTKYFTVDINRKLPATATHKKLNVAYSVFSDFKLFVSDAGPSADNYNVAEVEQ